MIVQDIVSTTPLVTVSPRNTMREAAQKMKEHRFSGLAVVDEQDGLVGIITLAHLIHLLQDGHDLGLEALLHPHTGEQPRTLPLKGPWHVLRVVEVMTRDVITVELTDTVQSAAQRLTEAGVHRAVVVDEGRPVHMLTTSDFTRAVGAGLIS